MQKITKHQKYIWNKRTIIEYSILRVSFLASSFSSLPSFLPPSLSSSLPSFFPFFLSLFLSFFLVLINLLCQSFQKELIWYR